jgi:hypothetical protein
MTRGKLHRLSDGAALEPRAHDLRLRVREKDGKLAARARRQRARGEDRADDLRGVRERAVRACRDIALPRSARHPDPQGKPVVGSSAHHADNEKHHVYRNPVLQSIGRRHRSAERREAGKDAKAGIPGAGGMDRRQSSCHRFPRAVRRGAGAVERSSTGRTPVAGFPLSMVCGMSFGHSASNFDIQPWPSKLLNRKR